MNPLNLAKQARSEQSAITATRRAQQQRAKDNATTFTGFWQSYDAATGLHRVQLADGGVVFAESGVPTGFSVGQTVTVSRSREQYGRIRVMR